MTRPLLVLCLMVAAAAPAAATSTAFDNAELRYSIELPSACRHVSGPGTLEAICAPDLDAERSKTTPAAAAILFEIDAEQVPPDAKPYTEAEFRQELPESICGESDASKVRIGNVRVEGDGARTTLSADVVCPAVGFLQLPERHAQARTVLMDAFRYRLMARWPLTEADMAKPLARAFMDSFKTRAK